MNFALLFSAARALDSSDGAGSGPKREASRRGNEADSASPALSTTLSAAESALAARVRNGDEGALEALVMEYYQPLVRFARGYVHSVDAAEDIVQAMFCRLWELRAEWMPRHMKAYLYTAVRRRALNEVERESVRELYRTREAIDGAPEASATEQFERTNLVDSLLMTLPESQRTAVRLRYQEGLSFSEIAAFLQSTPAAAERMVQRGVVALRARYSV